MYHFYAQLHSGQLKGLRTTPDDSHLMTPHTEGHEIKGASLALVCLPLQEDGDLVPGPSNKYRISAAFPIGGLLGIRFTIRVYIRIAFN